MNSPSAYITNSEYEQNNPNTNNNIDFNQKEGTFESFFWDLDEYDTKPTSIELDHIATEVIINNLMEEYASIDDFENAIKCRDELSRRGVL